PVHLVAAQPRSLVRALRDGVNMTAALLLDARGNAPDLGAGRHVAIDERQGADHALVAEGHALLDHALRADVHAVADLHRRAVDGLLAQAGRALDRVVRVDVHAGADRAVVADLQAARAVEDHVG